MYMKALPDAMKSGVSLLDFHGADRDGTKQGTMQVRNIPTRKFLITDPLNGNILSFQLRTTGMHSLSQCGQALYSLRPSTLA